MCVLGWLEQFLTANRIANVKKYEKQDYDEISVQFRKIQKILFWYFAKLNWPQN